MNYTFAIVDGEHSGTHTCLTCQEIINILPADHYEDGYYQGFVQECCNEYNPIKTPEELLEHLKQEQKK